VYDLQEPFRWLCDVTVIEAFEFGVLDLKDFYFMGDDYRYHIEVEAKRRLLELLKNRFNAGARYKDKTWKWDTVIHNKAQELAHFLLEKSKCLGFIERSPKLTAEEGHTLESNRSEIRNTLKQASSVKPFASHSKIPSNVSARTKIIEYHCC
jgi:CRISPR-associated protein Cas1